MDNELLYAFIATFVGGFVIGAWLVTIVIEFVRKP